MGTIAKVTIDNDIHLLASTAYAICNTSASTSVKEATIQDNQDFRLFTGETVHVKFMYTNTATAPTLNVSGTGAKPIYTHGSTAVGNTTDTSWPDGAVISLTYDGVGWQINGAVNSAGTAPTYSLSGTLSNHIFNSILSSSSGTSSYSELNFVPGTNVQLSDSNNSLTISAVHSHGGIQNSGVFLQNSTTTASFEDADRLLFMDASSSNMIKASNITFDGSTTTKYLSPKGTWVDIPGGLTPSSANPKMDGTASAGSSDLYARGDHIHPTDTSRAAATHDHGYIYSDGTIDTFGWNLATISAGDKLLIADADDTSAFGDKIKATGLEFGTGTDTYLRNDGTWATPASGSSYTATSPIDITNDVISHNTSGVSAGTYVPAWDKTSIYFPSITVDTTGHITAASQFGYELPKVSASQNGYLTSTSYGVLDYLNTHQVLHKVARIVAGATSVQCVLYGNLIKNLSTGEYISYGLPEVRNVYAINDTTQKQVLVDIEIGSATRDSSTGVYSLPITATLSEAYIEPIIIYVTYVLSFM